MQEAAFTSLGVQPTENDIILGRGVLHVEKTGNRRYYELLDSYMPLYEAAKTKGGKTRIVRTIYQELEARGARFLRKTKKTSKYIVIEPKHAKKKISHAIRYRRRSNQDGEDDDDDHEDDYTNNEGQAVVEHEDGGYFTGRRQQPRLNDNVIPDSFPSNNGQVLPPPGQVVSIEGVPPSSIPNNITFQQQEMLGDYNNSALNAYQNAQYLEYLASDTINADVPPLQTPTNYSLQHATSPTTTSAFGQASLNFGFPTFDGGGGDGVTPSSTMALDPSGQDVSHHNGNNTNNQGQLSTYGMTDHFSIPFNLLQQSQPPQQQQQQPPPLQQGVMHPTPTHIENQQGNNSKSQSQKQYCESSRSSTSSSGLFPSDDLEQVLGDMIEGPPPFHPM